MTTLLQKSKAFLWYLRRPRYYGEFIRLSTAEVKKVWQPHSKEEAVKAREWCQARALSVLEVLEKMGINQPPKSFQEKFKQQLQQAHEREKECPVKMGGGSDLALLFYLAEHTKAQRVIETGVAYGWSSLAFLLSLQQREKSLLISTDKPYPGVGNEKFVGCVVPPQFQQQWTIFREADRTGLVKALASAGTIDLCHYDSDKSYAGRIWAYPLLWNALRSGGIFISDDIGDNLAFKDFSEKINQLPIVVQSGNRFIGVVVKTGRNNS